MMGAENGEIMIESKGDFTSFALIFSLLRGLMSGKILAEEKQMAGVVTALKDYLSDETYENDFWRLHKFHNCYNLIWKCAEKMTYSAFYQAWHQQEKVKNGE